MWKSCQAKEIQAIIITYSGISVLTNAYDEVRCCPGVSQAKEEEGIMIMKNGIIVLTNGYDDVRCCPGVSQAREKEGIIIIINGISTHKVMRCRRWGSNLSSSVQQSDALSTWPNGTVRW